MSLGGRIGHTLRGAAIGIAEAIPGISGGTIALVTGIYERLIASAGHIVSAVRSAAVDVPRGRGWASVGHELRQVHWGLLIPIAIGVVPALLVSARVVEPLLQEYPQQARGLFLGLVLASLMVPISMVARPWQGKEVLAAGVSAVAAFLLTGLPQTTIEPRPMIVFLAAAIAVCALVLPGVSGSFLLLTVGLYQPTITALNDRDFGYLAVFGAGMVFGLGLFIKVLQWLLEHRRRITLAIMTGVMAGGLRSLWPWQSDDRTLQAPGEGIMPITGLFVIGIAMVAGMFVLEQRSVRRNAVAIAEESYERPSVG